MICGLLEKYGQGGPCSESDESFTYHNSFLIADCKGAWILETSGKHWVAEQVTSNSFDFLSTFNCCLLILIMHTGGYRNISNLLTITTKIDKKSDGILEYAKSKGFWNGEVGIINPLFSIQNMCISWLNF